MLSAGAATTLGIITVAAASAQADDTLVFFSAAWWFVAGLIGAFVGRRAAVTPAIGRLLADAKAATMMPEHRPGAVVLNRLWPLLVSTIVAGGLAFPALERFGDRPVLGEEALGAGRVAGQRGGGQALLAVAEGVVETGEDRVAGGGDDGAVERAVGTRKRGPAGVQRPL